jgi:hypothetical protein
MQTYWVSFAWHYAQTPVVEIIEQVEPVTIVDRASTIDGLSEPMRQLPEQTYYHALGQAFPLIFNSRKPPTAQRFYGSLGNVTWFVASSL